MPTVFFPGIVATLVDNELVFLAISSDKFIIFEIVYINIIFVEEYF